MDRETKAELDTMRREVAAMRRRLDQMTSNTLRMAVGLVVSGAAPDDEATGQEYEFTEIQIQVFERANRTDKKYTASKTKLTTTCHTPGEFEPGTFVILFQNEGDWIITNATCNPRIANYTEPATGP